MAIGLARIFGIKLPANFASPYKASNIVDFWKNWHMTLSRFLRDYLYIPLGGNRHGDMRRYANLLITMILGGLWHGANWTFVFWGGLHGAFLMINHFWRKVRGVDGRSSSTNRPIERTMGCALTFVVVVVAWVFFRADNWGDAIAIIEGMTGLNGLGSLDGQWQLLDSDLYLWLVVLLPVIWLAPNTQELAYDRDPVIDFQAHPKLYHNVLWRLRNRWLGPFAIACAVAAILVIVIRKAGSDDFIYMVF
jgi:D-alanyl-lipoteichoic acid acyltransferase DltB (MBOAT superfamily)